MAWFTTFERLLDLGIGTSQSKANSLLVANNKRSDTTPVQSTCMMSPNPAPLKPWHTSTPWPLAQPLKQRSHHHPSLFSDIPLADSPKQAHPTLGVSDSHVHPHMYG